VVTESETAVTDAQEAAGIVTTAAAVAAEAAAAGGLPSLAPATGREPETGAAEDSPSTSIGI